MSKLQNFLNHGTKENEIKLNSMFKQIDIENFNNKVQYHATRLNNQIVDNGNTNKECYEFLITDNENQHVDNNTNLNSIIVHNFDKIFLLNDALQEKHINDVYEKINTENFVINCINNVFNNNAITDILIPFMQDNGFNIEIINKNNILLSFASQINFKNKNIKTILHNKLLNDIGNIDIIDNDNNIFNNKPFFVFDEYYDLIIKYFRFGFIEKIINKINSNELDHKTMVKYTVCLLILIASSNINYNTQLLELYDRYQNIFDILIVFNNDNQLYTTNIYDYYNFDNDINESKNKCFKFCLNKFLNQIYTKSVQRVEVNADIDNILNAGPFNALDDNTKQKFKDIFIKISNVYNINYAAGAQNTHQAITEFLLNRNHLLGVNNNDSDFIKIFKNINNMNYDNISNQSVWSNDENHSPSFNQIILFIQLYYYLNNDIINNHNIQEKLNFLFNSVLNLQHNNNNMNLVKNQLLNNYNDYSLFELAVRLLYLSYKEPENNNNHNDLIKLLMVNYNDIIKNNNNDVIHININAANAANDVLIPLNIDNQINLFSFNNQEQHTIIQNINNKINDLNNYKKKISDEVDRIIKKITTINNNKLNYSDYMFMIKNSSKKRKIYRNKLNDDQLNNRDSFVKYLGFEVDGEHNPSFNLKNVKNLQLEEKNKDKMIQDFFNKQYGGNYDLNIEQYKKIRTILKGIMYAYYDKNISLDTLLCYLLNLNLFDDEYEPNLPNFNNVEEIKLFNKILFTENINEAIIKETYKFIIILLGRILNINSYKININYNEDDQDINRQNIIYKLFVLYQKLHAKISESEYNKYVKLIDKSMATKFNIMDQPSFSKDKDEIKVATANDSVYSIQQNPGIYRSLTNGTELNMAPINQTALTPFLLSHISELGLNKSKIQTGGSLNDIVTKFKNIMYNVFGKHEDDYNDEQNDMLELSKKIDVLNKNIYILLDKIKIYYEDKLKEIKNDSSRSYDKRQEDIKERKRKGLTYGEIQQSVLIGGGNLNNEIKALNKLIESRDHYYNKLVGGINNIVLKLDNDNLA